MGEHRGARRRVALAFGALVVALVVAVDAPVVTAQPPAPPSSDVPSSVPSTTLPGPPGPGGPTSTVPGTSSSVPSTTLPGASSSTTVPVTTIPPEIVDDPRAPVFVDPGPGDGGDAPVAQPSFDPGTQRVLAERVSSAQGRLDGARLSLTLVQSRLVTVTRELGVLRARLGRLGPTRRRRVAAVTAARRELREHTLSAFMNGRPGNALALVHTGDPVKLGVAHRYLSTVVAGDDELVRRYEAARRRLDRESASLNDRIVRAEADLVALRAQLADALATLGNASKELSAYAAGAQIYVEGFVFPVAGKVDFIDSWGFPRMTGTRFAHWHQGTDIFAAYGTPLVAVEDGVLDRIGSGTLGGNKLWVVGASGTEYYYAHLSAYAPGAVDGKRVRAGEVVGYVGNTGNAVGTPFHLHFEIHPGGGPAVNPYPVLHAVYSSRGAVGEVLGSPQVPINPFSLFVPRPGSPTTVAPGTSVPGGGPSTVPAAPPTTAAPSAPRRSGG